jgi:putative membrane protein
MIEKPAAPSFLTVHPSGRIPAIGAIVVCALLGAIVWQTIHLDFFEMIYRVALVAAIGAWAPLYLTYITTRYEINALHVAVTRGIITRRRRAVPLNRITNYELVIPLHKRLFGLADLLLDTAGGEEVEGQMKNMNLRDAVAFKHFLTLQMGEQKVANAVEGSDLHERRVAAVKSIQGEIDDLG